MLSSGSRSHLYSAAIADGCSKKVEDAEKLQSVEEVEADSHAVCLNADELRDLEEAFSELETYQISGNHPAQVESTNARSAIASNGSANPDATAASSMPSLSESDMDAPSANDPPVNGNEKQVPLTYVLRALQIA